MSKTKQLEKNVKLSGKLAEYIASNPSAVKNLPGDVSFVIFSSKDEELNMANQKLAKSLKSEGKKVVKAVENRNERQPWTFSLAV